MGTIIERRRITLKKSNGNNLEAALAMKVLADNTTDKKTKEMAELDTRHFYRLHQIDIFRKSIKRNKPR